MNQYYRNAPTLSRRRKYRQIGKHTSEDITTNASTDDSSVDPSSFPSYMSTGLGSIIADLGLNDSPASAVHGHLVSAVFYEPDTKILPKLNRYWERALDGIKGRAWGDFVYDQLAIVDSDLFTARLKDMEDVLFAFAGVEKAIQRICEAAVRRDPLAKSSVALCVKGLAMDVTTSMNIVEEILVFRRTGLLVLQDAKEHCSLDFQRLS